MSRSFAVSERDDGRRRASIELVDLIDAPDEGLARTPR